MRSISYVAIAIYFRLAGRRELPDGDVLEPDGGCLGQLSDTVVHHAYWTQC